MRFSKLVVFGSIVGLAAGSRVGAGQVTTIDFNALACATGQGNTFGTPFIASGFSFAASFMSPTAFGTWCSSSANFTGSPSLWLNGVGHTITLSKVGGGSFSLLSIMLARAFSSSGGQFGTSVLFTGTLPNAGQVAQLFSLPGNSGAPAPMQFTFPRSFGNVVQVSWQQGGAFPLPLPHQFDNVVVNPTATPEPTTLTLIASGLLGLGGVRLLKRRRSV